MDELKRYLPKLGEAVTKLAQAHVVIAVVVAGRGVARIDECHHRGDEEEEGGSRPVYGKYSKYRGSMVSIVSIEEGGGRPVS